jgi:hypothetical protein
LREPPKFLLEEFRWRREPLGLLVAAIGGWN